MHVNTIGADASMQECPEQARHLKRAALLEWQGVLSSGRNVN